MGNGRVGIAVTDDSLAALEGGADDLRDVAESVEREQERLFLTGEGGTFGREKKPAQLVAKGRTSRLTCARHWEPAMDADERAAGIARWHKGVERTLGWVDPG